MHAESYICSNGSNAEDMKRFRALFWLFLTFMILADFISPSLIFFLIFLGGIDIPFLKGVRMKLEKGMSTHNKLIELEKGNGTN